VSRDFFPPLPFLSRRRTKFGLGIRFSFLMLTFPFVRSSPSSSCQLWSTPRRRPRGCPCQVPGERPSRSTKMASPSMQLFFSPHIKSNASSLFSRSIAKRARPEREREESLSPSSSSHSSSLFSFSSAPDVDVFVVLSSSEMKNSDFIWILIVFSFSLAAVSNAAGEGEEGRDDEAVVVVERVRRRPFFLLLTHISDFSVFLSRHLIQRSLFSLPSSSIVCKKGKGGGGPFSLSLLRTTIRLLRFFSTERDAEEAPLASPAGSLFISPHPFVPPWPLPKKRK